MENFSDRGIRKSVDWALVVTYLLLILIGWVNIYASIHSDGPVTIFDYNFRSFSSSPGGVFGLSRPLTFVSASRIFSMICITFSPE